MYNFLTSLTANIIEIVLVIGIFALVICTIKFENSRQILLYIAGAIIICFGVGSAYLTYKEVTAESYIVGSLSQSQKYTDNSFSYSSTGLSLYTEDNNKYFLKLNLVAVDEFDGDKNTYEVYVNDYLILNPDIDFRVCSFSVDYDFENLVGDVQKSAKLYVLIEFFEDRTQLTLNVNSKSEAEYLQNYFNIRGFRLRLNELSEV